MWTPDVRVGGGTIRNLVVKTIAAVAVTAGTPQTIWTPAAGKKFRLTGYSLTTTVAGAAILKYGAGNTELLRTGLLPANGPPSISPTGLADGVMPGAADDALKIDVTVTGSVSGFVCGIEE